MKILVAYPNLPLMMSPAIAVGLFNSICKSKKVEMKLFETTEYSNDVSENRHFNMQLAGANRGKQSSGIGYDIKPYEQILPDFLKIIKEYKPDLIFMHVQEDVYDQTCFLLESIKDKNISTIVGGVLAIHAPDFLLENPNINMVCAYEGEEVLQQAIDAFRANKSFTTIDGIYWKNENGEVKRNKPCKLVNLNNITPDFDCYENRRWMRPMGGRVFSRALSMETYRGCPYQCTYCNSPGTRDIAKTFDLGNFMRRKSIDTIEKEINYYIEKINPDFCLFIDDSFLARPAKEIFDFCEMWSKYKIPFWFNTRIENCKPEYLAALKEAGVYRMTFGIESGNEEYRRKYLHRNVSNETYLEYFNYINESNIPYSLNIIIGMPYETKELILDSARLCRKARGHDGLTLSRFKPYIGTKLREIAIKAGFLEDKIRLVSGGLLKFDGNGEDELISMPKPYAQHDELQWLTKAFPLYAYYDDDLYSTIDAAQYDDELYSDLLKDYKKVFFHGEYQLGGEDKKKHINNYCSKHDIAQTYKWTEISAVNF